MAKDGRHTMNILRDKLKNLTKEEKQELLQEYQKQLMAEYGREKSNAMGTIGPKKGPHTTWILRKCIAMIKTSLNEKGYGYQHRG
jgi:ribosomal protein L29